MAYTKEQRRKYNQENAERIRNWNREYRKRKLSENPDYDKINYQKQKLSPQSSENQRRCGQVNTLRIRCQENGIPFEISHKDLDWVTHCPILGIELKRGGDRNDSPSIDRIIPELGYIKGNVRVISKLANGMKQNATRDQLEKFAENLLDYMDGKI